MRPRIGSNAANILKKMKARQGAVERELTAVATPIKNALVAESRRVLGEFIYDVPIPTIPRRKKKVSAEFPTFSVETKRELGHSFKRRSRAKREKLWKRTGQLRARETGRVEGPNVVLFNPMVYAAARYSLGTEHGRQISTPGVKSIQWQMKALERQRPTILRLRREALVRALTNP